MSSSWRPGGVLEVRHVDSLDELLDEAALVVNCSGVGARKLADDPAVHPHPRGRLCW